MKSVPKRRVAISAEKVMNDVSGKVVWKTGNNNIL